jgi:hypothetical protein
VIDVVTIFFEDRLLDELGDNVDRTEGRLKRAMHRVTDILRKEEGKEGMHSYAYSFD